MWSTPRNKLKPPSTAFPSASCIATPVGEAWRMEVAPETLTLKLEIPKSLAFVSTAYSCQLFVPPLLAGFSTMPTTMPLPLRCELGGDVPPAGGVEETGPPDGGTGVGGA